ncbi:MAG: hypothetical protein U0167_06280 [bacterium]
MPKNKDVKRVIRARMKKSGEFYTAARRQILLKKTREPLGAAVASARAAASVEDRIALAGMSDAAVRAKTGRTWREWVDVLDAAGARRLAHRDIAQHLAKVEGVPSWWSQMVAVGYERITGLRDVGQRRGSGSAGTYNANKSRTFPVPVAKLFRACRDAKRRARWLGVAAVALRRAAPSRSIRLDVDGARVDLMFFAKGRSKSVVQLDHHGLPTKAAKESTKRFWHERLDALAQLLREE